jgi:predicted nucleic acid-binding protein
MIHFDSSFLINSLAAGTSEEAQLTAWLQAGEDFGISAIAWGEFLCGPLAQNEEAIARKLLKAPEAYLPIDAEHAARLFNATGRRSRSFADCCIAAMAIRLQARLATSNRADFKALTAYGLALV